MLKRILYRLEHVGITLMIPQHNLSTHATEKATIQNTSFVGKPIVVILIDLVVSFYLRLPIE